MSRGNAARRAALRALCLALTLCALAWPVGATETATPAPDQPGVVRVLLTRLALTDRLDIILDGSYTLEPGNIAFQRGSRLTVSLGPDGIQLYYEGMTARAPGWVLRRHQDASASENGLRLAGEYSLHPGDLYISARDGQLRAVLHAPMEEYLLGVVPYEMSDTFPLEALKAQAVAARTYAQAKLGAAGDYDVTDNTNDQVYRGVNPAHTQTAQAVTQTRGLCGYIGKALARCYYTASNGGQTELMQHVWPDGGRELFEQKEDPHDLANPLSETRSFAIPKQPVGGSLGNAALGALFAAALAAPLRTLGYDGDPSHIHIVAVDAVQAHTPRYAPPSRLMTRLSASLRVQARRPIAAIPVEADDLFDGAATPAPTPQDTLEPRFTDMQDVEAAIPVDLAIFPDVAAAVGLSINGQGNELITVRETEDAFVLESRRFGHGVGLSQRGAEWMARVEGATYAQILQFYYPNIELKVAGAIAQAAPPIDAAFLTTPGPPATPTPRPTLIPQTQQAQAGQWLAEVTRISAGSTLNLRNAPTTQGDVLQLLYYGQPLLVLEELPEGWLRVRTDAVEGYVVAGFVTKVETP
ncbi:MAG: SpoIID/LytB domain-containing protein [Oscillospiraceae bacterium]|nr:SpoIID/LytB domain-containing protein [Oscillospiraceae bacterium]